MERSNNAVIPINVQQSSLLSDASQSSQTLDGSLQTMATEDRFTNLTLAQAVSLLQQFSAENHQLKITVQQCNASMQDACNKLASLKEKEKRKERNLCEKAKIKIQALMHNVIEKNEVVEELSKQIKQVSEMRSDYERRIDNLMTQVVSAQKSVASRDDQIAVFESRFDDLQKEIKGLQEEKDTLTCQANIYRADFNAERESRVNLNDQLLEQREKVERLEAQLTALSRLGGVGDLTATLFSQQRGAVQEIGEAIGSETGLGATGFVATPTRGQNNRQISQILDQELSGATAVVNYSLASFATQIMNNDEPKNRYGEYVEAFACPICQKVFPDSDSLQLHCNDSECIK